MYFLSSGTRYGTTYPYQSNECEYFTEWLFVQCITNWIISDENNISRPCLCYTAFSSPNILYYIQLPLLNPCFALPYQELLAVIPFVSLLSRPQGHADLLVSDWNNVCCDAGQDTGKQHQTDNPIRIKRFLSLGNPGIEHDPNRPITIYLPVPLTLWCSRNI